MHLKYRLGAILLAIFFVSCGDDSGGESSPPDTYPEFRQKADQALAKAACAATFKCPELQVPTNLTQTGRYADEQTCRTRLVSDARAGLVRPRETSALENGRAEYDQEQAVECIAGLRELASGACPSSAEIEEVQRTVCAGVLKPKQTADEPCNEDYECVSGHCVEDDASACYGSCSAAAEPVGLGEACSTASCEDGLLCEPTTDPETGFEYRCIQPGSVEATGKCRTSAACEDGLYCGGWGECAPLPTVMAEGENCNMGIRVCEPGLICADFDPYNGADPSGLCEPPREQGEQCRRSYECQPGLFCSPGATSSDMGTCEAQKVEGEACPSSLDDHGGGLHEACEGALLCMTDEASQEYRCVQPPPEDSSEVCSAS